MLTREPGILHSPQTSQGDFLVPVRALDYEQSSYVWPLQSPSPLDDIVDTLIGVLQAYNFRKDIQIHWSDTFKAFSTVQNSHPMLCEISECNLPPDKRPLERQAMFIGWVKSRSHDLALGLYPYVMKRYRREGGKYDIDKSESVVKPLCYRIADQVIAKHKAPKS
jgi:hypothetical protein